MQAHQNNLPASWPLVPLGAICEVGAGNGAPQVDAFFADGKYPFVRMQDVGRNQTPYITATVDQLNDLAIEKHNLKQWPAGSLLIPKSGASVALNKRALLREPSYVVSHLAVLVPGSLIDSEYLYYLSCTLDMMRLALDPAYPSLRTSDLARLRIPLPPVSEQRRIVEILLEAEEIRLLRAQAEAKTAELVPAIFSDIFGDLYFGKSPFPVKALTTIGELDRGKSKHRPRDEPSLYGGPYPFLQTGDIAQANGWVTAYSQTYSEKGLEQSRLWPKGTLAITIAANIGATAILTFDACFPDSIVGFTPNEGISVEYVRWWLMGYQKKLEIQAPQGAQKNINLEVLRSIQIPVPPAKLQLKFQAAIQNIQEQINATVVGEKTLKSLASSLAAHAFSGQLTERWRTTNKSKLLSEVGRRDAELGRYNPPSTSTLINFSTPGTRETPELFELPDELNHEQIRLLMNIRTQWTRREFDLYFTAEMLGKSVEGSLRRNPHVIEGHLAVLAARGLIIPVSREEQTGDTGEYVFGTAYRLPQREPKTGEEVEGQAAVGDYARLRELERLAAQLEKERALT